jgi:23S rRNA (cytosine1962-C5)-methyltransferase
MRLSLQQIATALQAVPNLGLNNIYDKSSEFSDQPTSHANGWLKGEGDETVIRENGNLFMVNWREGQKTGFFLDQRDNRALLAHYANGKNVLNTFCYSGGFSMYALKAGAQHVTSVDSSRKAMDWTQRNVELNAFETNRHTAVCDDVNAYLKQTPNGLHDLIILDPPAFAKHLSAADKAVVGYRNLNETAIRKIAPGGIIFTFSCSQAIDKQLFRKTVFTAAAKTGRDVRILHQLSQGADHPINLYHPEGEYLKGLVLRID